MTRTRSEVLALRRGHAAICGGCCDRFADNMGCDCLERAAPDVWDVTRRVVSIDEYHALARSLWSEDEFLRAAIALARSLGWMCFHPRPARTKGGRWVTATQGDAGYPDLTLCRAGRVVVAELKVGRNRPTAEQLRWIEAAGAMLWYPDSWPDIERILR